MTRPATKTASGAAVVAITLMAAGAVLAADLPETKLTIIGGFSAQPSWQNVEVGFWNEDLPNASGGKVTVDITPWNEMGLKGGEVFHMLRRGVAPIGNLVLSYNSGDVKENDGLDLALLSPTLEDAIRVRDVYLPVFSSVYDERYGLQPLALWPLPPQILYCRDEMRALEDLAGKKVRVSNASQAYFVQHFGGSDMNIAFGEVQTALQTGVVDCGLTSGTAGYKTGWHEAARYVYPIPINWQFVGYFANKAAWERIDPAVREFLLGQFRILQERLTEEAAYEERVGIACLTGQGECPEGKPGNMILVEVTEEDREARLTALEETILPGWGRACGAACVEEWNATVGELVGIRATAQ